jgi:hypothetical protein
MAPTRQTPSELRHRHNSRRREVDSAAGSRAARGGRGSGWGAGAGIKWLGRASSMYDVCSIGEGRKATEGAGQPGMEAAKPGADEGRKKRAADQTAFLLSQFLSRGRILLPVSFFPSTILLVLLFIYLFIYFAYPYTISLLFVIRFCIKSTDSLSVSLKSQLSSLNCIGLPVCQVTRPRARERATTTWTRVPGTCACVPPWTHQALSSPSPIRSKSKI